MSDDRRRSGVTLPVECWEWLASTAAHDGSSRDDLLEGLVLLAMDRTSVASAPPVRSCCGRRHRGAQCPDGLVVCCQCFERVPKERLSLSASGARIDVCVACAASDTLQVAGAGGGLNVPSNFTDSPTPTPTRPTRAEVYEALSGAYLALRDDPDAYARLTNSETRALADAVMNLLAGPAPAGTPETDHDD